MRGVGLSVLLLFQCAGEKLKHTSPFDETGPSVRGLSHINKMSQPFYSLWTRGVQTLPFDFDSFK